MANTQGRTRSNSAPSDGDLYRELDFDSALEALEAKHNEASQELDESGTDTSTIHTDGEPEDDDLDDIEEAVEVNTPDDDDDDLDEDTSLEPPEQKKRTQEATSVVKEKSPQGQQPKVKTTKVVEDEDEDGPPLSRKQRGKLIEELRQQLAEEQRQNAALQAQQQVVDEDAKKLDSEVARALGTQEEFDRVMEAALSGDEEAQELARKWKNNRAFYGKLVNKARKDTAQEFMDNYWGFIKDLPGITVDTIQKAPSLGKLLQDIHTAGVESVQGNSDASIAKLQEDMETLRGKYKSLRAKAGGARRSPVTSGGSPVEEKDFNWRDHYLDKKSGLFTDEAERIVEQYGFEALRSGQHMKR